MSRIPILALMSFVFAACSGPSETVCTLEARAGVNVTVTDSVSGAPVASTVTVIVQDGQYRDSTTVPAGSPQGTNSVGAAWEREGVYAVTVRADGYSTWAKSGVRVESGECHVKAVSLSAKLQPS